MYIGSPSEKVLLIHVWFYWFVKSVSVGIANPGRLAGFGLLGKARSPEP